MIVVTLASAASSLLSRAANLLRRAGRSPARSLVLGLLLGLLRTPAPGPALGSIVAKMENLAQAGLLLDAGAAALLVALALSTQYDAVTTVQVEPRNS